MSVRVLSVCVCLLPQVALSNLFRLIRSGCVSCRGAQLARALDLFERVMLREDRVRPDVFAPTVLINACGRAGFLEKASQLFLLMERLELRTHPKTITGARARTCPHPDLPALLWASILQVPPTARSFYL